MDFEKCLNCSDEWKIIDHETLRRETTSEQRDMMIWFKATVRIGTAKYRRHIPEHIRDWAKPETQSQERNF